MLAAQYLERYYRMEETNPHPHPAWKLMLDQVPSLSKRIPNFFFGYAMTDLEHDKNLLEHINPPAFVWAVRGGNHLEYPRPDHDIRMFRLSIARYETFWYEDGQLEHLGVFDESVETILVNKWETFLRNEVEKGVDRWRPRSRATMLGVERVAIYTPSNIIIGEIVPRNEFPSPTMTNEFDYYWHWQYLVRWPDGSSEWICDTKLDRQYHDSGPLKGHHFVLKREA